MLRILGIRPKGVPQTLRAKLPQLQAFVEVVITGGPRGSVAFEALTEKTFTVGTLPGLRAGQSGVFSYQNTAGKFRFRAKCLAVKGTQAIFALPERIETFQLFPEQQKRSAVRLDATVPGQWRYAPGGKGIGEWARGLITDISRTGASIIVDREVKTGTYVEVRFAPSSLATALVLLGEVMRTSKIEVSGKVSLGLRFHGLKADEDRAIMEFINKRQGERRSRGLA
jgi:c-di-GMP-binding flagellar brake protein YcgR